MFDKIFAIIVISLLGLCAIMILIGGIVWSPFLWLDAAWFLMMFEVIALCYFAIRSIWD